MSIWEVACLTWFAANLLLLVSVSVGTRRLRGPERYCRVYLDSSDRGLPDSA